MNTIDIEVEDAAWSAALPDAEALTRAAAEAAFAAIEPIVGSVAVLLTGDDEVAELNQQFRDKPGPTNVLSFPAPVGPEDHLGDIALAYGVCAREAVDQGKTLAAHLQHLVAHGVLHLVGYDHQTEAEAEDMEALERDIVASLGHPDPYA
ncbi:MAG: rRNA maturation RNase YbeY, partial [Caulobacterales bacterium 68-7]